MTSLLASRRRAEDFARLVENSRHSHDPHVAPLLELVAMLRPAPVAPSDAFRSSLRERLLSAAAEAPPRLAPTHNPVPTARGGVRTPTRLRVIAVAVAVVLAGGMAGTAAAARSAQPGDWLYAIKRGLERTETAVATNAESRGRQYLDQASTRLTEASALTGRRPISSRDTHRIQLSQSTLNDFTNDVRQGGNLLVEAYHQGERTAPITQILEFVANTKPRLRALEAMLPAQVDDAYTDAMTTLDQMEQRALTLCPLCSSGTSDVSDAVVDTPETDDPTATASPTPSTSSTPQRRTGSTSPTSSPRLPKAPRFPYPTNPGPRGPETSKPLPTLDPRLPLPWPWPSKPEPDPTGTIGSPGPTPTSRAPNPLPLPLPLPTVLPLPLPTALPLPLPLPLPWPFPQQGAPAPTGTHLPLPKPLPTQVPTTSPAPTPPTSGPRPSDSPAPRETLRPLPTIDPPKPEPSPTKTSRSIFDHLFGF
ncbi:DUF5667 domain-containing protein [Actinopolymorpha alba]|uniref:DUF5667 domain-containing protein n=1 Tax=Actinopolymorpha alba TaxID=533267 RepID=UPI00036C1045|nr:DUF5667 domain-containing protein [Actinopolymorpha alba]